MQVIRVALLILLCCMVARDSVSHLAHRLTGHRSPRTPSQLPSGDRGHMPAPVEGEEGESPLFKVKFEAETWIAFVPAVSLDNESIRERADVIGSFFSCSRELFNSLHRLRI